MNTEPSPPSRFESVRAAQLDILLDALNGVTLSDSERRSLAWLAGWERHVIEDIAAVITRARVAPQNEVEAASQRLRQAEQSLLDAQQAALRARREQ